MIFYGPGNCESLCRCVCASRRSYPFLPVVSLPHEEIFHFLWRKEEKVSAYFSGSILFFPPPPPSLFWLGFQLDQAVKMRLSLNDPCYYTALAKSPVPDAKLLLENKKKTFQSIE